jgi:Na+/H+ antiporter NhaD/arsenite permease-like protein
MEALILILFIAGYAAIAFENSILISKAAAALITGIGCWAIYFLHAGNPEASLHLLEPQVAEIAQILFFLIGAMTIVELVDIHGGFDIFIRMLQVRSKVTLLWLISFIAFFLAAVIGNLPTAIVTVSILSKLVEDRKDRLVLAGMIVIAANAGGAWSPIGDVTTTMLWIKDKFTATSVMAHLILPSLVCLLVPLGIVSLKMKGKVATRMPAETDPEFNVTEVQKRIVLALGLGGMLLVPAFKVLTHLPPFMGMLLVLGLLWVVTEIMHKKIRDKFKEKLSPAYALERIDIPSILFFLGILLAVGALQVSGLLGGLAGWLDQALPDRNLVVVSIGIFSAVVDNVPLVAGAIQMYNPADYPDLATQDHPFWQFLSYCAGTGGSILIIGSAAGVAVMGMERIEFFWYLKRISWLALIGYFAGAGVFLLLG